MGNSTVNASLTRIISLLVRGVAPSAAVATGLLPAPVLSASGDLDSTFGDFGRVGPIIDFKGPAWSAALLGNDTTLLAGGDRFCVQFYACYYYQQFESTNFLSELSNTGAPHPGFVPAQLAHTQIFDVALLPSGGIVAVGQSVDPTPTSSAGSSHRRLTVFQLSSDGAIDKSFGTTGVFQLSASPMENHQATSVVLDPDGRIVVAGPRAIDSRGSPRAVIVVRLLANGVLDDTFGDAGVFAGPPSDFVDSAIHILRTGAGGYRVTTSDCKIVALTADGKLDLTFGTAGIVSPPGNPVTCNAMAAQADGSLLLAGSAGPEHSFAGRLLANGTADPSFLATAVEASMADATALAVGADGSIVVAGTRPGGLSGDVVMRLQANGMLDMVFGKGGSTIVDLPSELGSTPVIHDLLVRPDGAVVAVGGDYSSNHPFVVRLVGLGGADVPGVLGVSANYVSVQEQSKEAIVKVQRTGGAAGSVSVAYQTVGTEPPTAAATNLDYTPVSGRLTWSDGDSGEQEIHVPIVADNVVEDSEYFKVVLSDPQGGAGLATRGTLVEIQPDGSPFGQFQIGLDTPSVTEPGTAGVSVSRNYYSSGAVSVTVTPKAGTATAGSDFAPTPVTLSWADGETGTKTVSIAIPDDSVQEPDETFTVELSNPTGGAIIGRESQVTVTIAASDQPVPSSGGGGGGSIGFGSLLLLAVARLLRGTRVATRVRPPLD